MSPPPSPLPSALRWRFSCQMLWMSLHNWSLLTGEKLIGFNNYIEPYNDTQFSVLCIYPQIYAVDHAHSHDWRLFDSTVVSGEGRLRAIARAVVFIPVVIGLGASSLLWYWLFSYDYGLINRGLLDLGIISKPVVWFGADATLGNWAVHCFHCLESDGLRHDLFIAAIRQFPMRFGKRAALTAPVNGKRCGVSFCP